tara:strand:+ start:182 stop:493 length:312 start_codon:yes stop_codon:yes gene_type:complete
LIKYSNKEVIKMTEETNQETQGEQKTVNVRDVMQSFLDGTAEVNEELAKNCAAFMVEQNEDYCTTNAFLHMHKAAIEIDACRQYIVLAQKASEATAEGVDVGE